MGKYDILHTVLTEEECDQQLSNFNIFHSIHFCYICTFTTKTTKKKLLCCKNFKI